MTRSCHRIVARGAAEVLSAPVGIGERLLAADVPCPPAAVRHASGVAALASELGQILGILAVRAAVRAELALLVHHTGAGFVSTLLRSSHLNLHPHVQQEPFRSGKADWQGGKTAGLAA
jgi:hypothetical protein